MENEKMKLDFEINFEIKLKAPSLKSFSFLTLELINWKAFKLLEKQNPDKLFLKKRIDMWDWMKGSKNGVWRRWWAYWKHVQIENGCAK